MDAIVEKSIDLSVIVPFFNEADCLEINYQLIKQVLDPLSEATELIYIDDGSTDSGLDLLTSLTQDDPRVTIISFVKNYGQTAALEAGFKMARGKIFITLDADNQNDPSDIPKLLACIDQGFDVVSGWRKNRQDGFWVRKLPSWFANKMISLVTGVALKDYGCTLKAYRAYYLDQVRLYGEMHRFIPAYASYAGAKVTEVVVKHHPRRSGYSKYGLERTFKVLLDLVTIKFLGDYATKPIYFFGGVALIFIVVAIFTVLVVAWQKYVLFPAVFVHKNPLFILALFSFMLGLITIMMGLIAELLMRTYHEAQQKKPYRIRHILSGGKNICAE